MVPRSVVADMFAGMFGGDAIAFDAHDLYGAVVHFQSPDGGEWVPVADLLTPDRGRARGACASPRVRLRGRREKDHR